MSAVKTSEGVALRDVLKSRTGSLHEALDASLAEAALADEADYIRFLTAQYAARAPIEAWARGHLDDTFRPPETARLIGEDLEELGAPLPSTRPFALPAGADPLGLAWAMGGSSLGNRALLARRKRAGHSGADRFLSDPAVARYFARILPQLSAAVDAGTADRACLAAEAVFRTFLAAAASSGQRAAA